MPRAIGRYVLHEVIASGGMASVHLGRMRGEAGFARTVAIKRLHPHLAETPEFVSMFLDEARIAARIRHPNVVAPVDVVTSEGELFLVMDYVHGESLSRLLRETREPVPIAIASKVITDALYGLHAAHEATTETGAPLDVVHRDVSPQNVLVGIDGVARVADFGIAKAASRVQSTREGELKGKLAYMAPEQLRRRAVDRRVDAWAAGVVFWEALAGRRLFAADDAAAVIAAVLDSEIPPLSSIRADVSADLEQVIARALARQPELRWSTAIEMADAIASVAPPAASRDVGAWVTKTCASTIAARDRLVQELERGTAADDDPASFDEKRLAFVTPEQKKKLGDMATRADAQPSPRRSRTLFFAASAFAFTVAAAAVAVITRHHRPLDSAPMTTPRPPEISAVVLPSATATATVPAPQIATVTAPPRSSASASRVVVTAPRPNTARASGASSASCAPAFTIDAKGVKRFKPWCF